MFSIHTADDEKSGTLRSKSHGESGTRKTAFNENPAKRPPRNHGAAYQSGHAKRRAFGDATNRKAVGATGGEKDGAATKRKAPRKATPGASTPTTGRIHRSKRTKHVTCDLKGYDPISTEDGKWVLVCPSCADTRPLEYDEVRACEECGLPSQYKSGGSTCVAKEWLESKRKEMKIKARLAREFAKAKNSPALAEESEEESGPEKEKAKNSPAQYFSEVLGQAEAKAVEAEAKLAEAHATVEALETENRGLADKLKRSTATGEKNAKLLKDNMEFLESADDSTEREFCRLESELSSAKETIVSQRLLFEAERGIQKNKILHLEGEIHHHQSREDLLLWNMDQQVKKEPNPMPGGSTPLQNAEHQAKQEAKSVPGSSWRSEAAKRGWDKRRNQGASEAPQSAAAKRRAHAKRGAAAKRGWDTRRNQGASKAPPSAEG